MSILSIYLKEAGLLQAEFAAKVGVGQATISRLARGEMRPGLSTAIKIARATGGAVPVESWQHVNAHGPASTPIQPPPVTVANDRGTE